MTNRKFTPDHYAPWEWQPLFLMPWGCCEVEVRYNDNSIEEMCSCDYHWGTSQGRLENAISFRYTQGETE